MKESLHLNLSGCPRLAGDRRRSARSLSVGIVDDIVVHDGLAGLLDLEALLAEVPGKSDAELLDGYLDH